jgi:hypothetical protein
VDGRRTYLVQKVGDNLEHLVLLDSIESGLDIHLDIVQLGSLHQLDPSQVQLPHIRPCTLSSSALSELKGPKTSLVPNRHDPS